MAARKIAHAETGDGACPILPAASADAADSACRNALAGFLQQNRLCEPRSARAIVASVPEPLESRLNDLTDQVLSAVLIAAEKNGHPFVDAWLPWAHDRAADQDSESSRARNPAELAGCHTFWPGVLLVAKYDDHGNRSASAMMLTGELPSSGIRRTVVERAATMSAALNEDAQLRLVGPVFSGSAGPLRETLLGLIEAKGPVRGARIWSGSATNPQVAKLLREDGKLWFQATVAPDAPALQEVYRFLVERGFTDGSNGKLLRHVAILREAETGYGQGFRAVPSKETKGKRQGEEYQARYEILFPLHISEVRSAWEKETSALQGKEAQSMRMPHDAVRVDLQERVSDARDDLPTFSSIASAYDERALTSALAALRDSHVDTVGIFATDTRDRLFLAEAVHRSAPDAQLFMLESDILLGHPDYAEALRGAIVASTYPLVTANQFWSGRLAPGMNQERRQFASSIAEGVYNATSLAFADLRGVECGSVYEYRWPLFGGQGRQKVESGKPPLWLTVVGPNALWPLAALDVNDARYMADMTSCAAIPEPAESAPEEAPSIDSAAPGYVPAGDSRARPPTLQAPQMELLHSVTVAFVLFCLCASGFAFLVVAALNGWRRVFHGGFLQPMLVLDPAWRGNRACRRSAMFLLAFAEVVVLLVTIWLGTAALTSRAMGSELSSTMGWTPGPIDWWHRSRVFAVSLAMAATAFALARLLVGSRERLRWAAPASVAVLAGWLGPLGLRALAKVFFSGGGDATGILHYWRMMHPFNLVSPLPMVLGLIAILLIGSSYWIRLIDLDTRLREPLLAAAGTAEEPAKGFWNSLHMLRVPSLSAPYLLGVIALFAAVWTGWNVRAPLDFHGGTAFFVPTLAILVVLGCGFEVWHLVAMWTATKRFLCGVEVERLTPAFNELRQEIVASLGHASGMREPHEHVLSRLSRLFEETRDPSVEAVRANLEGFDRKDKDRAATARERFLAMRVAVLCAYGVCRLRGVWFRLAACSMLFVASMACYPVHPHKDVLVLCWLVVGTVAGTTVWVFVEMNRNAVLSTIAGTKPNEVTWTPEFVEKLATVVGLPLLGIVTAAFPQVARVIGSLLGPIFHGH